MSVTIRLECGRMHLHDARQLLTMGQGRLAVVEAYLAMLHAGHAVLHAAGRRAPKTHRGLSLLFSGMAKDRPALGAELATMLGRGLRGMIVADHGSQGEVDRLDAPRAVADAETFTARVTAYLDAAPTG